MADPNMTDTVREAIKKATARNARPGSSPPLPETEETDDDTSGDDCLLCGEGVVHSGPHYSGDTAEATDEDAPGSLAPEVSTTEAEDIEADRQDVLAVAESVLQSFEEGGIPTIDTDHEHAAYGSGYRAGGDDPGYLLTLAELRRHLGSFFEPEEEEAFTTLNGDDFWSRWMLGYLDAAAGRMARPEKPRTAEEMDW